MRKDPLDFIEDILECIDAIQSYVKNITKKEFFLGDDLLLTMTRKDAVIHRLEIMGEAAKRISKGFQNKYAFVNWKEMIGMRNKLVHDYFEIDLNIAWEVATEHLPILKKQLLQIKKDLEKDQT